MLTVPVRSGAGGRRRPTQRGVLSRSKFKDSYRNSSKIATVHVEHRASGLAYEQQSLELRPATAEHAFNRGGGGGRSPKGEWSLWCTVLPSASSRRIVLPQPCP